MPSSRSRSPSAEVQQERQQKYHYEAAVVAAPAAPTTSTTATSSATSSATSAQASSPTNKCHSCIEMLKEVLVRSTNSRPHILLQSMMYDNDANDASTTTTTTTTATQQQQQKQKQRGQLQWREAQDGSLEVQIPAEPVYYSEKEQQQVEQHGQGQLRPVIRRRWSRLHPPELEEVLPTAEQQEAGNQKQKQSSSSVSTTLRGNPGTMMTNRRSSLLLASSSAVSSTHATNTNSTAYEWLQLTCRKCSDTGPEGGARAFVMGPSPLSIVVCSNRLHHPYDGRSKPTQQQVDEMQEILTHELVHVYDVRKLHLDLRDCENLAYSEVRAAREAECNPNPTTSTANTSSQSGSSWWAPNNNNNNNNNSSSATTAPSPSTTMNRRPLLSNLNPYINYNYYSYRNCVRQKAMTATYNLFPKTGSQCLNRVFETAMADTRPFHANDTNKTVAAAMATAKKTATKVDVESQQQQQQQQQPRSSR